MSFGTKVDVANPNGSISSMATGIRSDIIVHMDVYSSSVQMLTQKLLRRREHII